MQTNHDVYVCFNRREARALREHLMEIGDNTLVAFKSRSQWWYRASDSNVPFELEFLLNHDFETLTLHYVRVAWPADIVNMGKLPNGSTVWLDGERQVKEGGAWYCLSQKTYVAISREITARCLPRAWMR